MRKLLFTLIAVYQLIGCISTKDQKQIDQEMVGVYQRKESSEKLELKSDKTYTLWNPENSFTSIIEKCEYSSKGRWSFVAENVFEITSEDYYTKQKGFEYEIRKENRFSQDSLYIQVIFPTDFHPVKLDYMFNYNTSKSVITDKLYIALPKAEHLWNSARNEIGFSLNADVSGIKLYKARILFEFFVEYIDTEKFNFLTISLPNFDRCFIEFKPYYQDLIYIKGRNQLLWHGEIWKKLP